MADGATLMISVGSYLPERVMTNDDLAKMVDTSDEWIRQRTGIAQRHIVAEGEKTSDLARHAAVRALAQCGLAGADIDLIIVATST
ncbi:MAG: 3-oxoacyl-ACP synthase, partial [Candidatus Puniceispirillaceae bacterium]